MLPLCGPLKGKTLTFWGVRKTDLVLGGGKGVRPSLVEPLNAWKALTSHRCTLLVLSSYQMGKDKKQQVPEESYF